MISINFFYSGKPVQPFEVIDSLRNVKKTHSKEEVALARRTLPVTYQLVVTYLALRLCVNRWCVVSFPYIYGWNCRQTSKTQTLQSNCTRILIWIMFMTDTSFHWINLGNYFYVEESGKFIDNFLNSFSFLFLIQFRKPMSPHITFI